MGARTGLQVRRVGWSALFVGLLLVPLLLGVGAGGYGDLCLEVCLAAGVLSASVLVGVFVLPARLRALTSTFGIENVLRSHRWLGLCALGLVLGHVVLVLVDNPANLALLVPWLAPPRAQAATAATLALVAICLTSVLRGRLRLRYETWRVIHVLAAVVVLVGSALHVLWLHHLTADLLMRRWFELCLLVVLTAGLVRWVVRPLLAARQAFVIDEVRSDNESVTTLALRPLRHRHRGLHFQPGQFAWIRLDRPLRPREEHPFTIASGAHRPREIEFTVRHAGDFTDQLSRLTPGRRVYVDGPHGTFTVDARRSRALVLIAGGVGITPMMSMLRTQAHRRDPRRHLLVMSARSEQDLLFRQEVAELTRQLDLQVVEVLTSAQPGWAGPTGHLSAALLARYLPRPGAGRRFDTFICGSPAMVRATAGALAELGVHERHVHTEQFDMV